MSQFLKPIGGLFLSLFDYRTSPHIDAILTFASLEQPIIVVVWADYMPSETKKGPHRIARPWSIWLRSFEPRNSLRAESAGT
jgi:hypothetical protein